MADALTGITGITEITDAAELRALLGEPSARDAAKERRALHEHDRAFIAASPLCLVATSAADGTCDVSPKGDPAGFTHILDDTRIVLPERPGNRRADGFHNILTNPHIGLIYLVPGRGDTLRVNGRARLLSDAPFFDAMAVKGHRPRLAVLVEIEAVFYHCSKAFLRSALWKPETWDPEAAPSRALISKALERKDEPLAVLEEYYGPSYGGDLYGS
ncbi:pyridoxamine 5'-phosphate oxidase family protein [Streptomyces sp. CB01881]|uniref:pyridoxamine 5'-phosphate oxidase family protein n=1 Tax=Streptomyces sp. CB01881 TaxID=2078691 RepID=UPI000CDC3353|nr:pyridoxamine 5'-phosphate oxidase family protein [Streptomyces sp. CB01881]AUY52341.1 pyridoxamine 5'-phosphate oxidase [Streptomyces sp. CB01881]TYC71763.1 pyridoxamine 5'-phosphate oxidase family protein [Streptomyces sp. CB01881]